MIGGPKGNGGRRTNTLPNLRVYAWQKIPGKCFKICQTYSLWNILFAIYGKQKVARNEKLEKATQCFCTCKVWKSFVGNFGWAQTLKLGGVPK